MGDSKIQFSQPLLKLYRPYLEAVRAESLLEPRPVAHRRLRPEEPDRTAAGGDGGPPGRVGDVEDGQGGELPVDLGHGDVRRVGADDQALCARADEPGDAVLHEVPHYLVVVAFGQQVDVGVAS